MTIGDGIAVAGVAVALALMFMGVVILRLNATEILSRRRDDP